MHPMTPIFLSTFACSMGLQLAVALLVQEDVIAGHPWVQAYVAYCREWIPAVDRLAGVSSFPELTRLVISLMWTLVPMLAFVYWQKSDAMQAVVHRFRERPVYFTFLLLVPVVGVASALHPFFDAEGVSASLVRAATGSRLGLGLAAGVFGPAIAFAACILLLWLVNFRTIYLGGERQARRDRPVGKAMRRANRLAG